MQNLERLPLKRATEQFMACKGAWDVMTAAEYDWLMPSEFERPCMDQAVILFCELNGRWRVSPVVKDTRRVDWQRWPFWRAAPIGAVPR